MKIYLKSNNNDNFYHKPSQNSVNIMFKYQPKSHIQIRNILVGICTLRIATSMLATFTEGLKVNFFEEGLGIFFFWGGGH